MLSNWFKITLRHFWRYKSYSFITVFGLSIGLACCFLVLLLWQHEKSYDNFQANADRIYRVNYAVNFGNTNISLARMPAPAGPLLPEYFPEIETSARAFPRSLPVAIKNSAGADDTKLEIQNAYFADPALFDILTFEILHGNRQNPLAAPYSVVITDETAMNLFGKTDVIGQTIHFVNEFPFKISAVIKKYPENSHIEFDLIAPYNNIPDVEPESARETVENVLRNNWIASHSLTYVLLKPGQNAININKTLPAFLKQYGDAKMSAQQTLVLQPLRDIHFNNDIGLEPRATADRSNLRLFLGIGFITLIIACINFINLATALSFTRAGEVGIRKVLGAARSSLARHFYGETALLCLLAAVIATAIVQLTLPSFNTLVGREISKSAMFHWQNLALFGAVLVATIFLGGWYPSLFITRFRPVETLKGKGVSALPKGQLLRKSLITVQFIASVALIASTMIIYNQLNFLRSQELGFQRDAVINIPLFSTNFHNAFAGMDGVLRQRTETFEQEILQNPRVQAVTLSSSALGFGSVNRQVWSEKVSRDDNVFASCMAVDYDFLQTYELELTTGRTFDKSFGSDHLNAYVINESAVSLLGWDSPEEAIGKNINREGKEGTVVGVIKDFNYQSLRFPITALIMDIAVPQFTTFSIRIQPDQTSKTLAFVESEWNKIFPERAFTYTFLDETLAQNFNNEENFGKTINYFAFLAILISCFGLFGLTIHTIHLKTKEIGVRKVLGASVANIVLLLSKDFIRLVLIAMVIAAPLAWYFMNGWLQNFAYRIDIQWWIFVIAGIIALAIAFLTMSFQSIRAALANPVKSLRSE
ncbi:MAG: ABC transporter permease [Saprospiraceae bacterium]|nr:ABC transporter permease [Saprospiraceae bacterium]